METSTEEPPGSSRRRPLSLAALVLALVVAAGATWQLQRDDTVPLTQADVDKALQEGLERAQQDARATPPDAATAYRQILPSLVTITTENASSAGANAASESLGAGVIVNADGSVLTALHVVDGGGLITVRFADGTEANAEVISRQEENDTAVLAVDQLPEVTVPAVLGGGAQIGDAVFPVGNPLGLQGTLTSGVVSALGRSVQSREGLNLEDLIQFDAAVNPGNSGGPLLNRDGQVIGIVTALANPSDQAFFIGIGFAVPIATAGGGDGGPTK